MNDGDKIALITGANKGLGLEIARQLGQMGMIVLIGARNEANGREAANTLKQEGINAAEVVLEVTDETSIAAAAETIAEKYKRLDILVNNAGIVGDGVPTPSETSTQLMRDVYATNVFGVVAVTNAMLPLLRNSPAGRIVNASSGLGSLTNGSDPASEFGHVNVMAYNSSKTALNAVTLAYAKELQDSGIKVNAADPGFVATDLNQHRGYRTPEQGAKAAVRLATLPADGPTGTYQDENGAVPW